MIYYQFISSPIGFIAIAEKNDQICRIEMMAAENVKALANILKRDFKDSIELKDTAVLKKAKGQLEAFFAGKLKSFNLPLMYHGTDFQIAVWKTMLKIPYGKTMTYGDIARKIGRPQAFRAVGQASHTNNIPIVIPCHRVVGSGGALTGFAGGLWRKKWLLELEGVLGNNQISLTDM